MLRRFGDFLREVRAQWAADDALSLGAALAYYTVFSMAPLLVLVIAIAGLVLGRAAAEGELGRSAAWWGRRVHRPSRTW